MLKTISYKICHLNPGPHGSRRKFVSGVMYKNYNACILLKWIININQLLVFKLLVKLLRTFIYYKHKFKLKSTYGHYSANKFKFKSYFF